ncbi:MAG: hypothetical protein O7H39_12945 [Gammaproteobacteria bacterium]|nr:hypothetical protein [Gammaproteobacteria bacterium]
MARGSNRTHELEGDRRGLPRRPSEDLVVTLRAKGSISSFGATAVDFNRNGVTVVLDRPLPRDTQMFVAIRGHDVKIEQIVGVVHNCRRNTDPTNTSDTSDASDAGCTGGYRCGIRFRTQSPQQFDRELVDKTLIILERCVVAKAS